MKKFVIFTAIFYAILLTFASYSVSKAFFADMAVSQNNTFSAAAEFPEQETPPSTPSATVVINEIHAEGGADSEWIELFNPTLTTVILDGWNITDNDSTDTFQNGVSIPSNGYAVVVASGSAVAIPGGVTKIETNTTVLGNGLTANDRLLLEMPDNTDVDTVSWGSDFTYFTLPGIPSTGSLARQPNGLDTNVALDWAVDLSPSIGISND